jgi:hypothetical protein
MYEGLAELSLTGGRKRAYIAIKTNVKIMFKERQEEF